MPDLFVEECQQMQYHCLVGIASSIHRIWISIDRQIFLWNYLNRDSLDFFHHVADQVITCAVVAPAKLSVFGGEVIILFFVFLFFLFFLFFFLIFFLFSLFFFIFHSYFSIFFFLFE